MVEATKQGLAKIFNKEEKSNTFVIVTKDLSGLGWALKLMNEGCEVIVAIRYPDDLEDDELERLGKVGDGIIDLRSLDEVFKKRKEYKDAYWIYDQNNYWEEGEILKKEGFKILGGSKLAYDMENDREFAVELVHKAGIETPDTQEFSTIEEGVAYLEENEDRSFVFKPNSTDADWKTYCPDSEKAPAANEELRTYLSCLPDGNSGGFILQERIKGVETNFEIWLYKGKPYFAFCDLECKKKNNDDLGGLVGGAQDIAFTIPVECRGVQETVAKLLKLPEFKDYTGYLDINVIISDKAPYFLEFCARFGYPSHPTLLYSLALSPLSDILRAMLDGDTEDFYKHFKHGFGAGITLNADSRNSGTPIYVSEEIEHLFYPYDLFTDGEHLLLARADMEVGVITGHGYTLKLAAEEAKENMKRVNFPDRGGRTDLGDNDYASAPQARYDALVAMKYI